MSDERQDAPTPEDIRPLVGRASGRRSVWLFAAVAAGAAIGLFYTLEMRRERIVEPALGPRGSDVGAIVGPPDLAVPATGFDGNMAQAPYPAWPVPGAAQPYRPAPVPRPARQRIAPGAAPWDESMPNYPRGPAPMPGAPEAASGEPSPVQSGQAGQGGDRVQATRFVNPATTVPKGTIIQAVMETALDSTRPGFARGVVSRDVRGFDGTRVLIPRGSRLIGEYGADTQRGQGRAVILWSRLIRPDGVTIAIGSPAADPVGRGGVRADVNTHFLERFGGAILQSTLDMGVQLATRSVARDTVVVLPGGASSTAQSLTGSSATQVQPTLKVRQGASVSVFVARDLDFTTVEP